MKSPLELRNEVEDKHTLVGCELENLEEEIMQRDENISDLCVPLGDNEGRFHMSEKLNPTIIIEENHEFPSLIGGKEETQIHEEERKSLQSD